MASVSAQSITTLMFPCANPPIPAARLHGNDSRLASGTGIVHVEIVPGVGVQACIAVARATPGGSASKVVSRVTGQWVLERIRARTLSERADTTCSGETIGIPDVGDEPRHDEERRGELDQRGAGAVQKQIATAPERSIAVEILRIDVAVARPVIGPCEQGSTTGAEFRVQGAFRRYGR
jgi:hypothetical protein